MSIERDALVAQIHTMIADLDRARGNGTIYTYGNIQERLRNALQLSESSSPVGEPVSVADDARQHINRKHPAWHDRGVGMVQGSHYRAGFIAGAEWQASRKEAPDVRPE